MSRIGRRTVVRLGQTRDAIGRSSKPTIDRSRGTSRPASRAAFMTPMAISSLPAKIAVGGSAMASRLAAASTPDSKV
jgi:hypothetical protein